MSVWRERARRLIAQLTTDLPGEASIADRRKALWGKGWHAHQGTSWGKRMWGKEVRAYLARHGDAQSVSKASLLTNSPELLTNSPDIYFPFRGERDGQG